MHSPQPAAIIFGGGHISKSLAKVLDLAGFRVSVIDNREAYANRERFPRPPKSTPKSTRTSSRSSPINESTYIVIVTRGHRDDMRVLRWAVATPARYIAMIGSRRKVIGVIKELEKEGIPRAAFDRVYAPMGLEIGAVSPEEIAISVGAEMIADAPRSGRKLALAFKVHLRRRTSARAPKVSSRRHHPGRRRIPQNGPGKSVASLSRWNVSFGIVRHAVAILFARGGRVRIQWRHRCARGRRRAWSAPSIAIINSACSLLCRPA